MSQRNAGQPFGSQMAHTRRAWADRWLCTARRLLRDEDGQDLIEYALLTASVALVSAAGLQAIIQAIDATYGSWDTGVQSLWEPPNP